MKSMNGRQTHFKVKVMVIHEKQNNEHWQSEDVDEAAGGVLDDRIGRDGGGIG